MAEGPTRSWSEAASRLSPRLERHGIAGTAPLLVAGQVRAPARQGP
jgi:hypothetical protein